MKFITLIILSVSCLNLWAEDGVYISPVAVSPEYVTIQEGFKIVGDKVQIVRITLAHDGVKEVVVMSPALSATPTYMGDRYSEFVSPVTRQKHMYCETQYATAVQDGDTIQVKKWVLKKEVIFTCPFSKKISKRGQENGPVTENTYNLMNLDSEPLIESTTKNANTDARGFAQTLTTSFTATNPLIRIAP